MCMNKKTQLIATASLAVCVGWAGMPAGYAGPGSGPYGPYGSSGAYGGFGPYTQQVTSGEPLHRSRTTTATTYRETTRTSSMRRPEAVAEKTTYHRHVYRTHRHIVHHPAPVAERTVRTERTEQVIGIGEPEPRTSGQIIVDTLTAPFRMVGNLFVLGGRAAGSVVRAPARAIEATEPVAERTTTTACHCPGYRSSHYVVRHPAPVAERTTYYRPGYRTSRYVESRPLPVAERTEPRSSGQIVADTVTAPVRMARDVVVLGGRAAGSVVRAPARAVGALEPVAEKTTVEKTTVTHPVRHHRVMKTTTHTTTRHTVAPVGERTTRTEVIRRPATRTPVGTQGTEPVGERLYPSADRDYANPYR